MGLEILKDGKLKKLLKTHSGKEQSSEAARERIDQLITELFDPSRSARWKVR